MRIGFTYHPANHLAVDALGRARRWCSAREVDAWDSAADERERVADACEGTDLVCVLGGDGTFLRTAQAIGDSGVPALGVNLGRVGFLAKVELDDLEGALQQVLAGDYSVEDRFRISATLVRADGSTET
ncbi:MAG TPA: NAD(+)/NADH kinase, partial [Candidatus Limnocylindria bacterium]|nr:NAD(+)/NADH kinase [Candidatus Limnocylindria bacterium]